MAHIVAAHGNPFQHDFFVPCEGRVAEIMLANIENATLGSLILSFPWLDNNSECDISPDQLSPVHPVTLSSCKLALFDRFHE